VDYHHQTSCTLKPLPMRFDGDDPHYTQTTRLKTYINTLLVAFAGTTSWARAS
jgi:hypothetical protein